MKNIRKRQSTIMAAPYSIWCALFIVIPLLIIVFFSLTVKTETGYSFSLENFQRLLSPMYINIFKKSIYLALISTLICLIIGYPVAYLISKVSEGKRGILMMLFIIPMWMNFLLRTYAWIPILSKNGFLNTFLGFFGIDPIILLGTDVAVLLGMVYNFLPFMILPIYTVLTKMDYDLINAAADLGADRKTIFKKIIFPLSMPGVFSGIAMVFMPAVSTFAISNILGGEQFLIGNLIENQFITIGDWNFGSAISIFMIIIILISMAIMNLFEGSDDTREGTIL